MSHLDPVKPPALGVGVIWWPALDLLCRESEGLIGVIEAEPEAFWIANGIGFRSTLPEALGHRTQPKLLHGVGAPVGGSCVAPPGHTETFAEDVARLDPIWVSEHLNFSRFPIGAGDAASDPVFAGVLLPPAQSVEGVSASAGNIAIRRNVLGGRPIAFETGVSYLPSRPGEMLDGAFAAAVAEAAECGILLDLHNLFCNERNGRQTVGEFCASLPLERVWELHLAGGEYEGGFCLDAHSGVVEPALMELAADLVPRFPNLGAIVFEIMPDFIPIVGLNPIARQLESLHDLWALRRESPTRSKGGFGSGQKTSWMLSPPQWEALLGLSVTGLGELDPGDDLAAWWQSAEPAMGVYRRLAQESRAGMAAMAAPRTVRTLLQHRGAAGSRALLAEFWSHTPAAYTAAEEGESFVRFVCAAGLAIPGLDAAIAEDTADLAQWFRVPPV
jgi:uncharacterized protein (UPF0276 family)